jgi:hypothetical protein
LTRESGGPSRPDDASKLPVPAPWQRHVHGAIDHLAARRGFAMSQIAVTRVDPDSWRTAEGNVARGLRVWLMAGARTYRYVVEMESGAVRPEDA